MIMTTMIMTIQIEIKIMATMINTMMLMEGAVLGSCLRDLGCSRASCKRQKVNNFLLQICLGMTWDALCISSAVADVSDR